MNSPTTRKSSTLNSQEDLKVWIRTTWPRALAYALTLLRDRAAAEDVVQDCYCRLLSRTAVYDLVSDGVPLLLRSISNACINQRTRRSLLHQLDRTKQRIPEEEVPDQRLEEPYHKLLAQELQSTIEAALERLPAAQRGALHLKSLGHSLEEIASILGVSQANAGVLVHRARKAMTDYLAPYLGESINEPSRTKS